MDNIWNAAQTEEVIVNGEKYQVSVAPSGGLAGGPGATAKDLAGRIAAQDLPVWKDG